MCAYINRYKNVVHHNVRAEEPTLRFLPNMLPPLFFNFTNMENETSTVGGRILVSLVITPRCCTCSHITWEKEVCKYIKFTN